MQAQPMATFHQAGEEPIPGYRLLSPLGQGGFGEVWKCEAPGGLFKAIKFVRPDSDGCATMTQESAALEHVKLLRHPFILSLERVEEIAGELVIVMELADQSLYALQGQFRDKNLPGVPRDDLLGYMQEVAEALDWLNFEHGLQHLDVKPHNLFLISGHVKVADFGLVHLHHDEDGGAAPASGGVANPPIRSGGVTPLYSAPEMLRGTLSRHSDQYSLAVVYQQLLTGTVPFWHENVYELMMQHLCGEPDLASVPEEDKAPLARALSKTPEQRFGSCQEFVQALFAGPNTSVGQSGKWRRVLVGKNTPVSTPSLPAGKRPPGVAGLSTDPADASPETVRQMTETPTRRIRTLTPAQLAAAGDLASPPTPIARQTPVSTPLMPQGKSGIQAPVVVPPEDGQGLPAPTAVSLPGYHFVSVINQSPLSDLWRAEDSTGKPRRAQCLLGFVRYDTRMISHLKALRDRLLPPTEVQWSQAERLVVMTDWFDGTLRDRFEQRQAEGLPGIPRLELLGMLRTAAEALDALSTQYGLQHLGLHPRNLLIEGMRLWIADFGLIPLVWLPTGQSAATLNGRYAAPELFDRRPSRTPDQYSLALIFAEMLTGVHPRPNRSGSGLFRRPTRPGSGTLPSESGARSGVTCRVVKIDLDLLPAHDRALVSRALDNDPQKRFASCTEFIEALEMAGHDAGSQDLYHTLPPVIPYASLMGESAGPDVILPAIPQLVTELVNDEQQAIQGPSNCRYFIHPDETWEYRCPLQLVPGMMKLKIEGFRTYWQAQIVSQKGDSYTLHHELDLPRTFWERYKKQTRKLEIDIQIEPLVGTHTRLTEAVIRVRYLGFEEDKPGPILEATAPKVFESLRVYLQATQEQRTRERWPLTQPLRVYPILPNLDTAPLIEGTVRNISFGGIGFRIPKQPTSEYLYLHLYRAPQALGYALLARVLRVKETEDGFEIGAAFVEPPVTDSILE